ncbi:MAG: GNAT family N-acetyltransferase [Pseudomonadota bacterium]
MSEVNFRRYLRSDRSACLRIFDNNTPEFFAPNEREDFQVFLDTMPPEYEVCEVARQVIGSYGVFQEHAGDTHLHWILLDPSAQGHGIGSMIMERACTTARNQGAEELLITASHRSAPFFARFDAKEEKVTPDGWGKDMHRVDMRLVLTRPRR